MGLAAIWASFSHTYLVTLPEEHDWACATLNQSRHYSNANAQLEIHCMRPRRTGEALILSSIWISRAKWTIGHYVYLAMYSTYMEKFQKYLVEDININCLLQISNVSFVKLISTLFYLQLLSIWLNCWYKRQYADMVGLFFQCLLVFSSAWHYVFLLGELTRQKPRWQNSQSRVSRSQISFGNL
jgi:hypothetical protein